MGWYRITCRLIFLSIFGMLSWSWGSGSICKAFDNFNITYLVNINLHRQDPSCGPWVGRGSKHSAILHIIFTFQNQSYYKTLYKFIYDFDNCWLWLLLWLLLLSTINYSPMLLSLSKFNFTQPSGLDSKGLYKPLSLHNCYQSLLDQCLWKHSSKWHHSKILVSKY